MPRYYVNRTAQPNGDHEVHEEGCFWLGLVISKDDLGEHLMCYTAVYQAKLRYPTANGCKHCALACHTS